MRNLPKKPRLAIAFLCAIWLSLWSASVALSQPTSGPLSATLRNRVQNGKFDVITSIRGLPLGVRDEMTKMFGGTLDIAEPKSDFQRTGAALSQLPSRRMVAAACSTDFFCFIYYERSGSTPTWRVALFRWTPDETRFEWGGTAPGGLATHDDVRKAILSGAIKGQAGGW